MLNESHYVLESCGRGIRCDVVRYTTRAVYVRIPDDSPVDGGEIRRLPWQGLVRTGRHTVAHIDQTFVAPGWPASVLCCGDCGSRLMPTPGGMRCCPHGHGPLFPPLDTVAVDSPMPSLEDCLALARYVSRVLAVLEAQLPVLTAIRARHAALLAEHLDGDTMRTVTAAIEANEELEDLLNTQVCLAGLWLELVRASIEQSASGGS